MTKGLMLALAVLMCGIIQAAVVLSAIAQDRFPEALPGQWMNINLQATCLPVSTLRSAPNSIRPFVGVDGEGDIWFSETDPQTRVWTLWVIVESWGCKVAQGDMFGPHLMPPIPEIVAPSKEG